MRSCVPTKVFSCSFIQLALVFLIVALASASIGRVAAQRFVKAQAAKGTKK